MINPLTTKGFSQASMGDTLLNAATSRVAMQVQAERREIQTRFEQREDSLSARSDRWVNVKAQIKNAEIAVDNGFDAIKRARDLMIGMRNDLADMERDPDFHREQFDTKFKQLNAAMDTYAKNFNLIGNVQPTDWTPNEISYRNDLGISTRTLTGTFAGSDFYIADDSGGQWVPDPDSYSLEYYPTGYPGETDGELVSLANGVTLDSYDPDSGAITIKVNLGKTEETVTGTLHQAGNGLMGSWFYGNFEDADGNIDPDKLEAARQAITEAEIQMDLAQGKMASLKNQVDIDTANADKALDDLSEERRDLLREQLQEQLDLQQKVEQQYQAMVNNLDTMDQEQQRYLDIFGSTLARSPLLDTSI